MKLKQLITFKVVCEEESITKAASRLSTTQPAISRTIGELEEDLGIQLFDRTSRKVLLNDTGRLFLSKVVPLLDLYDDLERSFKGMDIQPTLKIGATPSIASTILLPILEKFQTAHPDIQARITVAGENQLEDLLLRYEIDMALTEGMMDHERFVKVPVATEPLAVLCSPSNPLTIASSLTASELAKQPLLLREPGSVIRQMVDSAFLFYNIAPVPVWTSCSCAVLLNAAKRGLGITILPRSLAQRELADGTLTELDIQDFNLSCTTHVTFLQDKYQTLAFQSFVNLILFSVT